MIHYFDTSALVKLYVRERGSADVRRLVAVATLVATSRVAYAEARAALARRCRGGSLSARGLRRAAAGLDADWATLVKVEVSEAVARRGGDLAESRALRGFDALHLASALDLRDVSGAPVAFVSYDAALASAAAAEGLPARRGARRAAPRSAP